VRTPSVAGVIQIFVEAADIPPYLHTGSDRPRVTAVQQDRANDHKVKPRERPLGGSLVLRDSGNGTPLRPSALDIPQAR
jgi:hypothetical protein